MEAFMQLMEIRAQKKSKKDEGLALIEKAEVEKRKLTPEEDKLFKQISKELDSLESAEERFITESHLEAELNRTPIRQPVPGENVSSRPVTDRSYRSMFYGSKSKILDNGGFNNLEEFFQVVGSGRMDERLQKRAMTVGVPSAGGFSVPEQFSSEWLDLALEKEVIRPRANVYPMLSGTLKIPGWDNSTHTSGSLFGGFTIDWIAENTTATRQTPKVRQVTLNARKGAIYASASRELVQDGFGFAAQLSTALIKGIGFGMDDAFINGTGTGQPLGIINSGSIVTVAKDTGQTADTISITNLANMEERLAPSCVINAVWIANPGCKANLQLLTVPVGTGGVYLKALTRSGDQYMLLDRPLFWTEKCPALGDKGDIILADLNQYAIGLRQEVAIDVSNAPGWTEDMIDYRVIVRVDGLPLWDKAFTPKNGSTQSWAVVLAAR